MRQEAREWCKAAPAGSGTACGARDDCCASVKSHGSSSHCDGAGTARRQYRVSCRPQPERPAESMLPGVRTGSFRCMGTRAVRDVIQSINRDETDGRDSGRRVPPGPAPAPAPCPCGWLVCRVRPAVRAASWLVRGGRCGRGWGGAGAVRPCVTAARLSADRSRLSWVVPTAVRRGLATAVRSKGRAVSWTTI